MSSLKKRKRDIFDDMAEEAKVEAARIPSDKEINKLRGMAAVMLAKQVRIQQLSDEMTRLQEEVNSYVRVDLPELMKSIGIDHLGMPEANADLELKPYYNANIAANWPADKRETAFKWLVKNKHGDLIKTEVKCSLERGQLKKAQQIVRELGKQGLDASLSKTVHAGTLTAFLREQIEGGATVPLDVIGGTVGHIVKLKARKEK